ncbi:hypothetical protein B5X24_HaOG207534 [Helicoverpa armigera]|nr:hypothetical protein B5X24_HaOG207534 [Helicoverpa armigera]
MQAESNAIIIIIISAIGRPLLNIGLPLRSPQIPVGGDLHPASSGDLVCPPCWWMSYAALAREKINKKTPVREKKYSIFR